jgi:zinc transport system permease protein
MLEALQFEFFRNAIFAGLLASIICGVIGTLVVVKRLVFLSGGIAHSAYGGIGLAAFAGWPYLPTATFFALCSGLLMALVSLRAKQRSDTIIGVMWALGMATGIILLDLTPGYHTDLMSYLFGSILTVPASDVVIMAILCLIILGFVTMHYRDLLAMSYDEEFAEVRGIPVRALYFILIGLISLTVVMLVQIVGLILVIALLTIPQYIAEKFCNSLVSMMVLATILGFIFTICGLWCSYSFDVTSGAAIILIAGLGFLLAQFLAGGIALRRRIRWLQLHQHDKT